MISKICFFLALLVAGNADTKSIPKPDTRQVIIDFLDKVEADGKIVKDCVDDIGNAGKQLRDFAVHMQTEDGYKDALTKLAGAVSSLSTAVTGCHSYKIVQDKLDALAAALRNGQSKVDRASEIYVSATNIKTDLTNLASAVHAGDSSKIASSLTDILNNWNTIGSKCTSKVCAFVDGFLKIVQTTSTDFVACEAAAEPIYHKFVESVNLLLHYNVTDAVHGVADSLDDLAVVFTDDKCGLQKLGEVLKSVTPKLSSAIIEGDKVLVGDAGWFHEKKNQMTDVFDELYQMAVAIQNKDEVAFGMQVGKLLQALRATDCSSKGCFILQGILGVMQVESGNFATCAHGVDDAFHLLGSIATDLKAKSYQRAFSSLQQTLKIFSKVVGDCKVPEIATAIEDTASKLGNAAVAALIGQATSVIVGGADVTDEFAQVMADLQDERWTALGGDLSQLSTMLSNGCHQTACAVVEGLLSAAGVGLRDLENCQSDLKDAQMLFVQGAEKFSAAKENGNDNLTHTNLEGLNDWSKGLRTVAKAVKDCGVTDQLGFIQQEAGYLGLEVLADKVKGLSGVVVHGTDYIEKIDAVVEDFETHEWREGGKKLYALMTDFYTWTQGHACTSEPCYILAGVVQALDIPGDFKRCIKDLKDVFEHFKTAFQNFASGGNIFQWKKNADSIESGIKALGEGVSAMADSAKDCHLQELLTILGGLAAHLSASPTITFLEEVLTITINAVNIEREVAAACKSFSEENWVQFGFDLVLMAKALAGAPVDSDLAKKATGFSIAELADE